MLASKQRIETVIRVLLIVGILFTVLIPTSALAKTANAIRSNYELVSVTTAEPKTGRPENLQRIDQRVSDQVVACEADANNDLIVLTGNQCSLEAGSYTFRNITVQANATLTLKGDPIAGIGVTLQAETVRVEKQVIGGATRKGIIELIGQGYPGGTGPGRGTNENGSNGSAGGAGYGGSGRRRK